MLLDAMVQEEITPLIEWHGPAGGQVDCAQHVSKLVEGESVLVHHVTLA